MRAGLAVTVSETRSRLVALRSDIATDLHQHMRIHDPDATTLCAVLTHIDAALHLLQEEKLQ